ncbi:MAG: NAD-dependent epimerase/dehydratase family protein [Euryarchaeota archaeon]|mgnify:CR=1 FL=1|jgi:dihydroflavonol-4-reductase|nr:NAD-dependent epimerase/dehydratase family protein [Euryarchaeota archaeon]MBT7245362.1 NAD-dependent epimerase/dehydratase family protein [Euryarchaeota archaeon]NCF97023.1 NAD-dependent epimerase/dehydratase family protein [Euryarchaeota archaeon]
MDGVVVVTGANGHIGNNLCKDLVANGYSVKGTVRSMDKAPDIKMDFVVADVLKAGDWHEVFKGTTGLFHLATIYSTSEDGQLILDTANLGTENVFRAAAAAGIKRIVYTSSVAAIGSTPRKVLKDESNWNSNFSLPYTRAKTESEKRAWELAEELGLDLRVINPSGVLGGSFSRPTPSTDIIGDAMKGKYPVVPKIPLAFVHVEDVATAHRLAYENDDANGRYLLAPHQGGNIHDLLKRARKLYPKMKFPRLGIPLWMLPIVVFQDWIMGMFTGKRLMTRSAAKSFSNGDSRYSNKKVEEELGIKWKPFDDMIHDTVAEYNDRR